MGNGTEDNQDRYRSPYMSPNETIKQKCVSLLYECIELKSTSYDEESKYSFVSKVKDLSIGLERYTPTDAKKELKQWYNQMKTKLEEVKKTPKTDKERGKEVLEVQFAYSIEVHEHNHRILMMSPIVEIEAKGEMDITDEETVDIIRGGKRKDDVSIVSK